MEFELLNNEKNVGQLNLDPRTKIIILIILTFIIFAHAPFYITFIVVLIPFFCLFFSNNKKIAIFYIGTFILSSFAMIYLIPITTGALNSLIIIFSNIICRMLPGILMGYYLITTTKVSEFVSSMEKINMPQYIIIPISVIFRYFPTLYDEIKSISDAMKMRGIGLNFNSLKSPLNLLEYIFVPILVNAVKTSDDLSAASLTRGLSNPKKRTNICTTEIRAIDIIFILVSFIGLALYILYKWGGISLA